MIVGDANVYWNTNNNLVIFVIALGPFFPFLSKSTWEMRKITWHDREVFIHWKGTRGLLKPWLLTYNPLMSPIIICASKSDI